MTITFEVNPIETAPKDKRWLMLWCGDELGWRKGRWLNRMDAPGWYLIDSFCAQEPTHWAFIESMAVPS